MKKLLLAMAFLALAAGSTVASAHPNDGWHPGHGGHGHGGWHPGHGPGHWGPRR